MKPEEREEYHEQMKKAEELAEKEENKSKFYVVRGYPTKWRIKERVRHTTNLLLKRKVEESEKISCQNTTLKLINIQGLTKTKNMEVEKFLNDHIVLFLTELQL